MRKVLVTGSAGLLGNHVVRQLADLGVEVHALVRNKSQSFRADVRFYEADLAGDLSNVLSELPAGLDTIFHLAQAREFREFPQTALRVFDTNLASTAQLLDFGSREGISNFVYASSGGVYSPDAPQPLLEDSSLLPPEKLGFYLGTKYAGEALALSYSAVFAVSVLRYFFIYGPNQARAMLVPRLFDAVRDGAPIYLTGRQGMLINPVHAEDAASATVAAGTLQESAIFNIAGPEVLSLRQICDIFARELKIEPNFQVTQGASANLVASIEKAKNELLAPARKISTSIDDISTE